MLLNTINVLYFPDPYFSVFLGIGVIHEGYEGVGIPTFWTERYRTSTFRDEKVRTLLSTAVNRGDVRRINYNKTVFRSGLLPGLR